MQLAQNPTRAQTVWQAVERRGRTARAMRSDATCADRRAKVARLRPMPHNESALRNPEGALRRYRVLSATS